MTRPADQPAHCRCGTQTEGDRTCEACLNRLDTALGEMAWLDEQLEIAVSRQRGASFTSGGHSSGETPLPYNDRATRAERRLHATLARWVRRCVNAHVAHQASTDQLPRGDGPDHWSITDMARWLMWRTDGLAAHTMGHQAMLDITSAAASATQTVTWKRSARIFLGPCDDHAVCDGEVYADEDADEGACDSCGRTYPVDERRAALEAELSSRLFPAREIAKLATILDLGIPSDQVRKRVNLWHHRGRITAAITDPHTGEPLFRFGEVRALLDRESAHRRGA